MQNYKETINRLRGIFSPYMWHLILMVVALGMEPFFYLLGDNDLNLGEYNIRYFPYSFPLQLLLLGICVAGGKIGLVFSYVLCSIYSIYILTSLFIGFLFKSYWNRFLMLMVHQTGKNEILNFFEIYPFSTVVVLLLLLAAIFGGAGFYFKLIRREPIAVSKDKLLLGACLSIPIILGGGYTYLRNDDFESILKYPKVFQEIESFASKPKNVISYIDFLKKTIVPKGFVSSDTPVTGIVILGESATRNHMGIYGYEPDTTPLMTKRQNEWLCCKRVTAATSYTIGSVPLMFSNLSLDHKNEDFMSLIPLLENPEAKTVTGYLSNQYTNGNDNGIRQIFTGSTETVYVKYKDANSYDGDLLAYVADFLKKPSPKAKKLLVIHLLGSHAHAGNRYPRDQFSIFSNHSSYVDDYNNSIYYTDHVIEEIVKMTEPCKNAWVLYCSDHGDTPSSSFLRDTKDLDCWEIPYCFWFGKDFKKNFKEKFRQIEKHSNVPFQADLTFQIICWLMDVSWDEFPYDEIPFGDQYKPKEMIYKGIIGLPAARKK